jgi:hypothetical protein
VCRRPPCPTFPCDTFHAAPFTPYLRLRGCQRMMAHVPPVNFRKSRAEICSATLARCSPASRPHLRWSRAEIAKWRLLVLIIVGLNLLGVVFDITLYRFGFDLKSCRLPGIPAADEGARFSPTRLSELLRHTGAGSFLWSGAITDNPAVTG